MNGLAPESTSAAGHPPDEESSAITVIETDRPANPRAPTPGHPASTPIPLDLLIVEDRQEDADLQIAELRRAGFEPTWRRVETEADFLIELEKRPEIILSDYAMPEFNGLRALDILNRSGQEIPFILISGTVGEDVAVGAMRQGATDYLLKDRTARLGGAVTRALEQKRLRDRQRKTEEELHWKTAFLEAQVDSALDGILVVDRDGKKILQNQRLVDLWKLPARFARTEDDPEQAQFSANQTTNPRHFSDRVNYLYSHPDEISRDEIELLDGTVLDRYSSPVRGKTGKYYGRIWTFRDVTEQRKAEAALQESEGRYRALVEWSPEAISVQRDGKLLFVNPAAVRMMGAQTARDLVGKASFDFVHPDSRQLVRDRMKLHAEGGEILPMVEEKLMKLDGTTIDVELRGIPIVYDGEPALYGSARDVTASKRAEEALQRQQAELRVLFDFMPARLSFKDTEGRFLRVNQRLAETAGKTVPEIEGKSAVEIFPEEAARQHADDLEVIRSAVPKLGTVGAMQGPAGQQLWFQTDKVPVCDRDGKVIGIVVMVHDITARRQAEESLREQARLLDLVPDAIMVRDLDGRILFWSRGAERIYGWTAAEAIGRDVARLLHTNPEKFAAANDQTLATGEARCEVNQRHKNGSELLIHGHLSLLRNEAGEPKAFLVINRDVTEQRKLEAQLLRSQRVESLGTLASGVAHDLNNILAPILMSVQLLRGSPPPATLDRLANLIETSAQRGADIVKQVLTFGRGVTGDRLPLRLGDVIKELELITLETFPKNITIRADLASDLSLIEGDATQIHQVLLNLFVNARDAMPHGGTLTIAAGNFDVDESYAAMFADAKVGPYVQLTVTDTGSGMSSEVLDKMFDPFFTTKPVGQGTGLGLSTVVGIVKTHGGFLSVQSEVGLGSTFQVFLPVTTGELLRPARTEDVGAARGRGEKILIVDDESALRIVTEAILLRHGYDVIQAGDGAEAIAIYARQSTDIALVLTDVMMPMMDGVALCRALRRLNPDVRIIASTGQGGEPRKTELKSFGVQAFLTKPYSSTKLLQTIHDLLSTRP